MWLRNWIACLLVVAGMTAVADVPVHGAVGESALASMPVREVTVFKDGHAFVLHEGEVPTDEKGNVHLDYLPTPVIGTFWPYSADPKVKLVSVAAGRHRVSLKRTALNFLDLLKANIGSRVTIRENNKAYRATIVAIPTRSAGEVENASPAGSGPQLPQPGKIILLKTDEGTRVIAVTRIQDVTFHDDPESQVAYDEIRNLLRLELDWGERKPGKKARVGMTYLQRGIRWIPHYNLKVNDDGTVLVQLQATLLNELADLENVTAHLLVGVPSFDFKSTVDPIALRDTAAQLSRYFREPSQTAFALSNSIMVQSQMARMGDVRRQPTRRNAPANLGPDVTSSGQNEEMYIFTIENVTLAKGERMVLPVGKWKMKYEDVYRLEIPFEPPVEVRRNFRSTQQAQLAKLFYAPKVKHVLRITNDQKVPLTTAPALITSGRGVLGQGMMTYTSPGGSVDLTVTTAVNVSVLHQEDEVKRIPNAANWEGHKFSRVELKGSINLTNYRDKDIHLEVIRMTMGIADKVGADGTIGRPAAWTAEGVGRPGWWSWYSWPGWWFHMNSQSRFRWDATLKAGDSIELPYEWHYFWR